MGSASNKKAGMDFNGDYKKLILVRLGKFQNLKDKHYKDLSAADHYEIDRAFEALPDASVMAEWKKIQAAQKPSILRKAGDALFGKKS